jgi:hypothetical protein
MSENTTQVVKIDLNLFVEEVNLILTGLDELPHKVSRGLIDKIKEQAIPQLPQQAPQVVEDTAEKKLDPAV